MACKLRDWRRWLREYGGKATPLARKVMENEVWGQVGAPPEKGVRECQIRKQGGLPGPKR